MAAYWISRCVVNDPVQYKKYTDLVPTIIAVHGGRVWPVVVATRSWRAPKPSIDSLSSSC